MVSITAVGTVDEHLRKLKRQKTKNIKAVMQKTKKVTQEEMIEMFDPVKKSNETVGIDSEEEFELEDEDEDEPS